MNEVEKLRALLAEARKALSTMCDNDECCGLRERIDAALSSPQAAQTEDAEPVDSAKDVVESDEAKEASIRAAKGMR